MNTNELSKTKTKNHLLAKFPNCLFTVPVKYLCIMVYFKHHLSIYFYLLTILIQGNKTKVKVDKTCKKDDHHFIIPIINITKRKRDEDLLLLEGRGKSYLYICVCSFAQSCPTLLSHGLQPTRLLCPWNSPGKNTGVGRHTLLQFVHIIKSFMK